MSTLTRFSKMETVNFVTFGTCKVTYGFSLRAWSPDVTAEQIIETLSSQGAHLTGKHWVADGALYVELGPDRYGR